MEAIAFCFYDILVEHVKKFIINTNGGLLITKDLGRFKDCFARFKNSAVDSRFETLRELGNVFIVQPQTMKSLIEEGLLARLDRQFLHSFIVNRADYKQARLDLLFAAENIHNVKTEENQQLAVWERFGKEFVFEMDSVIIDRIGKIVKDVLTYK